MIQVENSKKIRADLFWPLHQGYSEFHQHVVKWYLSVFREQYWTILVFIQLQKDTQRVCLGYASQQNEKSTWFLWVIAYKNTEPKGCQDSSISQYLQ